jgi:hypothetical protein
MQLFATRFEYRSSFHIFVTSLKSGSGVRVAERNAFARSPEVLEKEVAENLEKAATWTAESVSGRPLDPKRDLGEHSVDANLVKAYIAFSHVKADPRAAEAQFKAIIEAGGGTKGLGLAGLGAVAAAEGEDPHPFLEDAMKAGNYSASLYFDDAQGLPAARALALLKTAAKLNTRWAEPVYEQVKLTANPLEKEKLLRHAAELDQREPKYWLELAQLQITDGHAIEAQSSWQRAEDEAVEPAEKARIHELRVGAEQTRLDAADAERVVAREAVHQDEARAQQAEQDRIRAAEEKANSALDAEAGSARPTDAVPWDQALPEHKTTGVVSNVECLKKAVRVTVVSKGGKPLVLLSRDPLPAALACGKQEPPKRVFITWAEDPDDDLHTEGRIRTLRLP